MFIICRIKEQQQNLEIKLMQADRAAGAEAICNMHHKGRVHQGDAATQKSEKKLVMDIPFL
jgi:hypothetical protein